MHSSFFNYNVQRPYPYIWFTPLAVSGGILLTVLLSIMNFVQNSYVLTVEYANDPNSTITNHVWYKHWPSYLTNGVRPTCQPVNLPVSTQFFTNQSGLIWTITNFFNAEDKSQALPSLPYLNDPLQDCNVTEIQIVYDVANDLDVTIAQSSAWSVEIRAFVTCGVSGPAGYTLFNTTAVYNSLTPFTTPGVTTFISRDATNRASLYWSEVLLSANWVHAVNKVWAFDDDFFSKTGGSLSKGVVMLYPNKHQDDIRRLEFFDMQFDFLEKELGSGYQGMTQSMAYYISQNNNSAFPHIWSSVDGLAKAMYSAVLTDLGQTQYPSQSNIVTTGSTIQHFTSNFSDVIDWRLPGGTPALLENQTYDARQSGPNPTGALGLSRAVVATNYLCQVPRLKPIGDIFVSVLVADMVLLQVAWKLYAFLVDKILSHRRANAMYCEGCLHHVRSEADNQARGYIKGGISTSTATILNQLECKPDSRLAKRPRTPR